MTGGPGPTDRLLRKRRSGIENATELLAHAYAIEVEAEERYKNLAAQMEVHNNPEVAALFRKLADIEGLHAKQIIDQAGGVDLVELAPWDYEWPDMEPPESINPLDVHYLMPVYHALRLALQAEQNAFEFFEHVALTTADPDIRRLATEMAEEEREHVRLVGDMLGRHKEPDPDWADDPDPPVLQE